MNSINPQNLKKIFQSKFSNSYYNNTSNLCSHNNNNNKYLLQIIASWLRLQNKIQFIFLLTKLMKWVSKLKTKLFSNKRKKLNSIFFIVSYVILILGDSQNERNLTFNKCS